MQPMCRREPRRHGADGRGSKPLEWVVQPARCRFVPLSPTGFVDNATIPVRTGEPSAE